MFKLKSNKILDTSNRVVGIIIDGKFRQNNETDSAYKNGLSPLELEQVSEVMQSARIIGTRNRS